VFADGKTCDLLRDQGPEHGSIRAVWSRDERRRGWIVQIRYRVFASSFRPDGKKWLASLDFREWITR